LYNFVILGIAGVVQLGCVTST